MLSNASNSSNVAKDGKTFGFSVKDILDLPNNKSKKANASNCSSLNNGNGMSGVSSLEPNSSDPCLPSGANTSGYPTAASLYYNAGIYLFQFLNNINFIKYIKI